MKVPRGTPIKVRAAYPEQWERAALAAGIMTAARVPLAPDNCEVNPGTFEGIDLESGRARRAPNAVPYLRARCSFSRGDVRVVTVLPTVVPGDIFWIRSGGARNASRFILEVEGIDIARLQDMTDADALACGAALLPGKFKRTSFPNGAQTTPREWFQKADPLAWRANGWVWVVRFKTHRRNVDDLLAEWRA